MFLIAGAGLLAGCSNSSAQNHPSPSGPSSAPPSSAPPSSAPPPSGTPSSDTPSSAAPSVTTPPTVTSPAPSTSPTVGLPAVRSWAPGPGEIEPEVKRLAVAAVVKLLQPNGARAVVEVIDAQYGGILSDSASVLVPCRVYSIRANRLISGGTTVDVRLSRSPQGTWRVTATHPAQPGAPVASLSAAARQVLASEQISLPPASAADIRSGQVHDSVLTTMLELAKTYRIGISVIRSGHPIDVFGTDRPSDHPRGRAFDTWQINGRAVVSPSTPRSLVTSYMRTAESLGSYNVGGPYQLSGTAFFSDRTHHDHVHAGFRS
ncbi:hypothetical protein GCM10009630_20180 [Kribbella jejuensis]|uniref:Extensin-like C-terminal domain-containing protein n=1 Tax=Kribbella jejuensis TaxID=236068 RepID=A0A542EL05_9ACTN|nr:hypothetical protein FB475_0108 [Kribbella jejuensis]